MWERRNGKGVRRPCPMCAPLARDHHPYPPSPTGPPPPTAAPRLHLYITTPPRRSTRTHPSYLSPLFVFSHSELPAHRSPLAISLEKSPAAWQLWRPLPPPWPPWPSPRLPPLLSYPAPPPSSSPASRSKLSSSLAVSVTLSTHSFAPLASEVFVVPFETARLEKDLSSIMLFLELHVAVQYKE